MSIKEMHEGNRVAWNEGAAFYQAQIQADVDFLRAGGKNLCPPELTFLRDLSTWCRRAIHLQCAGGRDTLSLWNHGAQEVIGVDISDTMIECARRKTEALGAPARWFRCDVLETPHELDGTADLVYTGRGALYWLQDLEAWAGVVARLLAPGGRLYIFEGHPLCGILDIEASDLRLLQCEPNDPDVDGFYSYFSSDILKSQGWPETYIGNAVPKEKQAVKFERLWTLGDIMNALVGAGLRLERFEEHAHRYWNEFPNMPAEVADRFPHTFSLLMRKP